MIEPIDECLYELEDVLALLIKGDKWTGMADRLTKLLTQKWGEEQKEAIRNAIKFFAQNENEALTKDDVDVVLQDLQDKLGERMSEVFRKDIQKIQLESYSKGHTDVGVQFEFHTADKKALRWLSEKDVKQFWIGDSYAKELNEKLNLLGADVLKQGLTKAEAGKYFKEKLGDQFKKTNNYWELLAHHVVVRAREFGRVSAYEKAGVTHIKLYNPAPESEICKFLNGRIIPVGKITEQRDKLLAAETVEAVKIIAPWYRTKEVKEKITGVPTEDLPEGVGLPPYHGHCKTTTVIAYANEIDTDISQTQIPGGNLAKAKEIADKLQVKLDNFEQLKPDEIVKLKELALNSGWNDKVYFKGEKIDSLKYHYNIHKSDETIDASSISDYNQKLFNLIRSPNSDVYLTTNKKYGLQAWFYDGSNLAIISPGKEDIGTFHQMRKDFLIYLQSKASKYMKLNSKGIMKWIRRLLTD